MFAKGETIIQCLERLAPKHIAEPEDKIGLQVGSLRKEVSHVLVALDVTAEVAAEAAAAGAELIIAHHAVIYRPLAHLRTDTPAGALAAELLKRDIAVYIAHTNLDSADGGMNDWMADALGLIDRKVLREAHTDKLFKLVVYVPESHGQTVRDAIFAAGAGWIGNYSHCSFTTAGTGTFLPHEGSDPYIGKTGKVESVAELKIETVVPQSALKAAVNALLKAHPYEEPAYDIYPMDLKGRSWGLGRVGKLAAETRLDAFAESVKQALDVPFVRVVGPSDKPIRKVAVLGGSGARFVNHALFAGADVLVTGDIDYHTAQDALAAGIALIDPGHNAEKIMKDKLAEWLQQQLQAQGYKTKVSASQVNTEPFRFR